jgi:hypothetical protein
MSEECENSMPFFDGEIYYKIRSSHLRSDSLQVAKWVNRITSHSKRVDYERLHASKYYGPFCDALDELVPFPALLFSFHLGNIRRFFRMKCPEELAAFLHHMRSVWAGIMRGFDTDLLSSTDVKYVQGRSPAWSSADRIYIEALFRDGQIFPHITDRGKREVLKSRMLAIDGIIPSMTTFMENTKYLEPAAILLRELLPGRFRGTIRRQMRKFYRIDKASDDRFWLSYQQLWLTALRLFPYLTGFKPLQDRRGYRKEFTGNYWGFFARSAIQYGFRSSRILKILQSHPMTDILQKPALRPAMTTNTAHRWRLKDRCGMPTEHMFEDAALFLSVENIYQDMQCAANAVDLTPFAVARDGFRAFFGNNPSPSREMSMVDEGRIPSASLDPLHPTLPEDGMSEPPSLDIRDSDMDLDNQKAAKQPQVPGAQSLGLEMMTGRHDLTGVRLLPPPQETVVAQDVVPDALPTPFPPTINASTAEIIVANPGHIQSDDLDLWQRRVPKEVQRLSPSRAKAHFEKSNWDYALYVYNDQVEPHFYYPAANELALVNSFIQNRRGWWYASYHDGTIITINPDDVQSKLENDHFILCGNDSADLWRAKRDVEAEEEQL